MWGFIYTGAFIAAFAISAMIKLTYNPFGDKYTVHWDETIGKVYTDLSYGDGEANKDISAVAWVNENSVPTVCAYGAYDKMQAFPASIRLDAALTEYHIPHEYIVCPHSGHGLQNDNKLYKVLELAGISDPEAVVVTGYSAGGFGAALLADDIFTNYFPNAESKNVLVDASLLLYDDWHTVATDVWQTPKEISDKLTGSNLTLDCLTALHEKYGDDIHLLFDSSTRDGDLAKVQNYLDTGVMDVTEKEADIYQQILKDTIPQFQGAGVSLFIWDGVAWYDDPRDMTAHTIIATPAVWLPFEEQKQSVAGWLADAINGDLKDYGLDLVNKKY